MKTEKELVSEFFSRLGKKSAESLTKKERSARASKASKARWAKWYKENKK